MADLADVLRHRQADGLGLRFRPIVRGSYGLGLRIRLIVRGSFESSIYDIHGKLAEDEYRSRGSHGNAEESRYSAAGHVVLFSGV